MSEIAQLQKNGNYTPQVSFSNEDIQQMKVDFGIGVDVSDFQFKTFVTMCRSYGLDPRLRQISAWVQYPKKDSRGDQKPKLVIHIGIDGWIELANRHPTYKGMVHDVIYHGDKVKRNPDGTFEHIYGNNRGNKSAVIGAYCTVYRSDRDIPITEHVNFQEFTSGLFNWNRMPGVMIGKVAISRAVKRAFSVSGAYSDEEIESMEDVPPAPPVQQTQTQTQTKKLTADEKRSIYYNDLRRTIPILTDDECGYIMKRIKESAQILGENPPDYYKIFRESPHFERKLNEYLKGFDDPLQKPIDSQPEEPEAAKPIKAAEPWITMIQKRVPRATQAAAHYAYEELLEYALDHNFPTVELYSRSVPTEELIGILETLVGEYESKHGKQRTV